MNAVLRTLLSFLGASTAWLFAMRILNILPSLFFLPAAALYFYVVILLYFSIANDDMFSTILGIFLSVAFTWLFGYNALLLFGENMIVALVYCFGTFLGILQTIKSVGIRFGVPHDRF